MIKVIKEGKVDTFELNCPNCDCIFQCETPDFSVVQEYVQEYEEKNIFKYYQIHCPCCNSNLNVSDSMLSKYIV